jgi:hypothetical protein
LSKWFREDQKQDEDKARADTATIKITSKNIKLVHSLSNGIIHEMISDYLIFEKITTYYHVQAASRSFTD